MLLVGYCCGIRHERRLCQEVALHLALPLVLQARYHTNVGKPRYFKDIAYFELLNQVQPALRPVASRDQKWPVLLGSSNMELTPSDRTLSWFE